MPATSGLPAAGTRVSWADLPAPVRAGIERACGAPVASAQTQHGGFSPGLAVRALCADRTRVFIKAVSAQANPDSHRYHQREARVLAALDPLITTRRLPIPRLRATATSGTWTALVIDDVDGRQPTTPWQPPDIDRVLTALDHLAEVMTPASIPVPAITDLYADAFTGWRTLARQPGTSQLDPWTRAHLGQLASLEQAWAAHAAGQTLLHTDLRADNLLLTSDRVMVVDWAHACRGAAFVDPVLLAVSVAASGGSPPSHVLARSRAARAASRDAITAIVCAAAGYYTERALRPPPPGLQAARAHQAAQGRAARQWLAQLLDVATDRPVIPE
jgi:aminoglycoside phosphotransferase (APT) family kinase protein